MTKTTIIAAAEIALRTIRSECGIDVEGFGTGDRTALARRSGQLCVIVALLTSSSASVSVSALELAGVERMVGPDELAKHILRPLVTRGFCRISQGVVIASSALSMHSDPIGALMGGESLAKSSPVRSVAADSLRPGDYILGVGEVFSRPTRDDYGVRVTVRTDGAFIETHLFGSAMVARAA